MNTVIYLLITFMYQVLQDLRAQLEQLGLKVFWALRVLLAVQVH